MNTQNDFLDNAVDDGFGIDGIGDLHTEMCSSMQNDIEEMCSSMCNDKYRKYRVAFKTSYKTEYRSGIGNERDGFDCGGEQSNI